MPALLMRFRIGTDQILNLLIDTGKTGLVRGDSGWVKGMPERLSHTQREWGPKD